MTLAASQIDSPVVTIFLPLALAVIMFGLGLTLTIADFKRVAKVPKAAIIALAVQILVLPAICFALVLLFALPNELAVGMMLLAAAPGGTTANLFSHLAGGDVALNITLTAINSVLAVVTLPLIVGLSVAYFLDGDENIGLQPQKMLQVFAIVLVPVAIGMFVHARYSAFAARMERPVKIASVAILVIVVVLALIGNFEALSEHVLTIGAVALLLCSLSLAIGYWIPKLAGVQRRQAIASGFEIGIHNSTLAITIAISVIGNDEMAIPPAIYGVLMYLPAAVMLRLLRRQESVVA